MEGREGPFWDVMAGRRDPPPAATLLGWTLVGIDPDNGTIDVRFTATEQFLNPAGDVQGGLLRDSRDRLVATATATAIIRRGHA